MNKQETIKYLTDLMATIQMAYFKGRLGERNSDETGGDGAVCGDLWVHETHDDRAAVSIDLYHFGGDGEPVCEGLNPCTITFDDGSTDTGWLFCMCYDPDEEQTPLVFEFSPSDESDDIDIDPEDVPEEVLKDVTAWLEKTLQQAVVKYRVLQITADGSDAHFIRFSPTDELRESGLADRLVLSMYSPVYEGETARTSDWLDTLFARFQGRKPEGYTGHSLSVSDIIEADGRYYYCDSFGWTEVTVSDGKIILPDTEKQATN